MKLNAYLSQFPDFVPYKIRHDLGHRLSAEHLKLTGERPIKTPEYTNKNKVAMLTNEYPEWFLDQVFNQILDTYLNELTDAGK